MNSPWKNAMLLIAWMGVPLGNLCAQHLVNGGFEGPFTATYTTLNAGDPSLPGWTIGLNGVDISGLGNPFLLGAAYQGSQYLDLDGSPGPGMISQSFETTPGVGYQLNFAYATAYPNAITSSASIRVYDTSGDLLADTVSHSGSSPGDLAWGVYHGQFTANGTTATLEFRSLSPSGSYGGLLLDGIEVVPEPSLQALCIAGLVTVIAGRSLRAVSARRKSEIRCGKTASN